MPAIGITGEFPLARPVFASVSAISFPLPDFSMRIRRRTGLSILICKLNKKFVWNLAAESFRGLGLESRKLRAIVFGDTAKKRALEQVLHPRIRRKWSAEAETHRDSPDFSSLIFPFFMKLAVKRCATE